MHYIAPIKLAHSCYPLSSETDPLEIHSFHHFFILLVVNNMSVQ